MKTRFQPSKLTVAGLLLCLMYYGIVCWLSSSRMTRHSVPIHYAILFGSGFAGLELSVCLLMPVSKAVRRALGFLLGVNGAIAAFTWVLSFPEIIFFILGLVQFFYFSCYSIQELEKSNNHG